VTDGPPKERTLAEALDDVQLHDELEKFEAMAPAAQEQELEALGYDAALTRKSIEAGREAAYAAKPPAKVVDLPTARARRGRLARWAPFAAVAAIALAVGGTGYQLAFPGPPATTTTFATVQPPPTSQLPVSPSRKAAFRLCELGYYDECQDALDAAQKDDPEGERSDAVRAARKSIVDHSLAQDPNAAGGLLAKPPLGPKERPLQRRH
jgi:hypothetical protein